MPERPPERVSNLTGPPGGWDVDPDGRILVLTPVDPLEPLPQQRTVMVVQNFFDELRRRPPVE